MLKKSEEKLKGKNISKNYQRIRNMKNIFYNPKIKNNSNIKDMKIEIKKRFIPIRMFYPKNNEYEKVIIYFHGGGWVSGNIDTYSKVCLKLATATKCLVVSVEYPLAPENKFPDGFNDCYDFTKYVFKHPDFLNVLPENIILMGDSAGANLACSVSLRGRNRIQFIPTKQILIYPPILAFRTTNSFPSTKKQKNNFFLSLRDINDYTNLYKRTDKDLKNQYFALENAKSLRKLPKTLIITAGNDILKDEGYNFYEKLKAAGNDAEYVNLEHEQHGYFSRAHTKSVIKTFELVKEFINK